MSPIAYKNSLVHCIYMYCCTTLADYVYRGIMYVRHPISNKYSLSIGACRHSRLRQFGHSRYHYRRCHQAIIVTLIFTARAYARAVLGVVILSVCLSVCLPSVTRVHCDKTKSRTADIFIPHERAITPLL